MKNLHNLINKALQLHEEGKIKDAIRLYSEILQSQNNDPQLLFMLGTAYVQIGKIEFLLLQMQFKKILLQFEVEKIRFSYLK